jgi:aspartyl-tRNA(Asn)/glutamyl-tRNA(Gln) amidotransferase subunit A
VTQISLTYATLASVSKQLADRDISSVALSTAVLKHIQALNPSIGAISDVLHETAMVEAQASDMRRAKSKELGPLDGVPITIKDLIDTTPAICKAGLEHLANYRPQRDARVVTAMRQAGAVIVGVTETDSGAFGTRTLQVINPLEPQRIVGGSSGGSGAALASGMGFATLGTDTGGSIRIPSACCSVCGFKPSFGALSLEGIRPLAPSLDHVGPMARSVADLQILYSAMSGEPVAEPIGASSHFAIGMPSTYFEDADPEVKSAMAEVRQGLIQNGHEVRDIVFPGITEAMRVHMVIALKEIAEYHLTHFADVWQTYPDISRLSIELGQKVTTAEYAEAEVCRVDLRKQVDTALGSVDFVILPTLPMDAPLRDAATVNLAGHDYSVLEATVRYTALFDQTGHPAVAMPGFKRSNGRTLGIQLVGGFGSDTQLLAKAHRIERDLAIGVDYAVLVNENTKEAQKVHNKIVQGTKT